MHKGFGGFSQEKIVFLIALALFVTFSVITSGFLQSNNILQLVRNVSVLGILGVAMAIVVIGRGIDLAIVSIMAMATAWSLQLMTDGSSMGYAIAIGLVFSLAVGLLNGFLIAFVEIPPLFASLAVGTLTYGAIRLAVIQLEVVYLPPEAEGLVWLGSGSLFGIPVPVIAFALACLLGHLFLVKTRRGRFIYSIGDNPLAARISGVPVRPTIMIQYAISAMIGYGAGLITAASVSGMNTRVALSNLVYDVILVVVIGGIGLSGGRGGIRNVIVGTLLIGILINGMTILNVQYTTQNIVKSGLLLAAILFDSLLNPRDEQTAQQGDI
ncbi:MAG: ribose transport system permease protein [Halocynthiibacter sp.]|jgi:ribose transport system permease protein